MSIITTCVSDKKYFTFRQYESFEKEIERTKELQHAGYSVFSSMSLENEKAKRWIDIQRHEMEANGFIFDGCGAFIE